MRNLCDALPFQAHAKYGTWSIDFNWDREKFRYCVCNIVKDFTRILCTNDIFTDCIKIETRENTCRERKERNKREIDGRER